VEYQEEVGLFLIPELINSGKPLPRGGSSFRVVRSEKVGGRDSNQAPRTKSNQNWLCDALESLPPAF